MTVIYAAARFEALRLDRKRHRERECRAILGQVPEAVAVAILIAVRDQSEEPLYTLPPRWRERAISAWRECRGAK